VGTLVFREARVAVDAEQRPSHGARIGHHVCADPRELRAEGLDEAEQGIAHLLEVPSLVRLEPLPVVVASQLTEEPERARGDVAGHGGRKSSSTVYRRGCRRPQRRRGAPPGASPERLGGCLRKGGGAAGPGATSG